MNIERAVQQATARAARAVFNGTDGREALNLVPASITKRAMRGYHHWREQMDALQLALRADADELDAIA